MLCSKKNNIPEIFQACKLLQHSFHTTSRMKVIFSVQGNNGAFIKQTTAKYLLILCGVARLKSNFPNFFAWERERKPFHSSCEGRYGLLTNSEEADGGTHCLQPQCRNQ
jgi:hypothetical protein